MHFKVGTLPFDGLHNKYQQEKFYVQEFNMYGMGNMWQDLAKPSVWDFKKKSRSLHRSLVWPLKPLACVVVKLWALLCACTGIIEFEKSRPKHVAMRGTFNLRILFAYVRARIAHYVTWQSADFDVSKWSIAKDREERQPARNQANGRTR